MSIELFNTAASVARVLLHSMDAIEDLDRIDSLDEEISTIHTASAMYKTGLIVLKLVQAFSNLKRSTSASLALKDVEVLGSVFVGGPIEFFRTLAMEKATPDAQKSVLRVFERGVLFPIVASYRAATERQILDDRLCLEKYNQDHRAKKVVIISNGDGSYERREVNIDPAACETNIKENTFQLAGLNAAEITFQISGVQRFYAIAAHQLFVISQYFHNPGFPYPLPINAQVQNNVQPQEVEPPEHKAQDDAADPFDLIAAHRIPPIFSEDRVLSEFNDDTFLGAPARFPVPDLTKKKGSAPTWYNLEDIREWVRRNRSSPFTRAPLGFSDLQVDRKAQAKIEDRLRVLQTGINQYIRSLMANEAPSAPGSSCSTSSASVPAALSVSSAPAASLSSPAASSVSAPAAEPALSAPPCALISASAAMSASSAPAATLSSSAASSSSAQASASITNPGS